MTSCMTGESGGKIGTKTCVFTLFSKGGGPNFAPPWLNSLPIRYMKGYHSVDIIYDRLLMSDD